MIDYKQKDYKEKNYDDILHLPHHVSLTHPHMSVHDRAAQFALFAALTGHSAAIRETARLTDEQVELDENMKQVLDERMQIIQMEIDKHPKVQFTVFVPDAKKEGGAYTTITGRVKRIDTYTHRIVLLEGDPIDIGKITDMEILI